MTSAVMCDRGVDPAGREIKHPSDMLADEIDSVSEILEEGNRVLAHVRGVDEDRPEPRERFVVAEVHEGQIMQLRGYATMTEASRHDDAAPPTRDAIVFHPLRRAEFGLLRRWLAEPLVKRWWNHDTSPSGIERDFGSAADRRDPTTVLVAELADRPFGLIQHYPLTAYPQYLGELSKLCDVPGGALSIDYLIGEPDLRGCGLGTEMIAACVDRLWAEYPQSDDVIVPVPVNNRASWRALERAGFQRIAEGALTPDNPRDSTDHYVYRRTRAGVARARELPWKCGTSEMKRLGLLGGTSSSSSVGD